MRVAVVTGGNRGLGRQVALDLLRLGYTVVLGARDAAAGAEAAAALGTEGGGEVVPVAFDSTDPAGAARIRAAVDALGRLDALVNNAAHIFDDELPEEEAVRRSFETNTLGPLRLTRALAEALRADGGANVVNVSTGMAGLAEMGPGYTGYRLSKVALNGLTRVLHHELGPQVRVNAVCPGWVRTRMGGPRATRTVEAGARGITWAATLGPGGPSGGFFRDGQPIPW